MKCKICKQDANHVFTKKVLRKYDVKYYQCPDCAFLQTEEPYWLDEAYNSAINYGDIGLISRNLILSELVTSLFCLSDFSTDKKYIDYGGGYGIFVRIMRDNGFNFYWYDEYCENIYVKKFDSNDLPPEQRKFDALTAFEVFEHLVDPLAEIEKMLTYSDSIIFSTVLTRGSISEIENWWYIGESHGQHIAIFNKKTLEYISNKLNLNLYTSKDMHLLTRKKINKLTYKLAMNFKFARLYNTFFHKKTLLQSDYDLYMK